MKLQYKEYERENSGDMNNMAENACTYGLGFRSYNSLVRKANRIPYCFEKVMGVIS